MLGKARAYDIRIYTGGRTKTITLRILKGNTELYKASQTNRPGEEVAFSWKGIDNKNKPVAPGRYTLKVEAQIEQRNAPVADRSHTRQFEHHPAWLK